MRLLLHTSLLVVLVGLALPGSVLAATGSGGAIAEEAHAHPATGGQATVPASSGGLSADAAALPAPVVPAPSPSVAAPAAFVDAPLVLPSAGAIVAAGAPYKTLITATARRRGVSVSLLTALVWQESGFRFRARSAAGARGLTQLMPGTARDLGVRRIYDPAQNLDGGARYLKGLLVRFGSASLALAAYNAGPGAVVKHGGIPPYGETRRYVRNVLAIEARLRAAGLR